MKRILMPVALALAASACGSGGGDGGYCAGTFQGGNTDWACTSCSGLDPFKTNQFAPAIDNDGDSARAFSFPAGGGQITIRIDAPSGMSFPGGANSGALIHFPAGVPVTASYNLYNGTTPVAATSGGTIATGVPPDGAGSPHFYPVTPATEINRIDIAISASGTVDTAHFALHEVCGDH